MCESIRARDEDHEMASSPPGFRAKKQRGGQFRTRNAARLDSLDRIPLVGDVQPAPTLLHACLPNTNTYMISRGFHCPGVG